MADYKEIIAGTIDKIVTGAKELKDNETVGKVVAGAKELMESDTVNKVVTGAKGLMENENVTKVVNGAKGFMESDSVAKVKSNAKKFMEKDSVKAGTDRVKAAGSFVKGSFALNGEYDKLKKAYAQLGKLFYENCKDCEDEIYADAIATINDVLAAIAEVEVTVSDAKSSFAASPVAEDADFEAVVEADEQAAEEEISVEVFEDTVSEDEQE